MSETEELARWFREEIQGLRWSWDDDACRRLAGEAKRIVNPKDGPSIAPSLAKSIALDYIRWRKHTWRMDYWPSGLYIVSWRLRELRQEGYL